jgi:hypothetical protein
MWREIAHGPALFFFTALVHLMLIGYVFWRIAQRLPAEPDQRVHFAEAAIVAQTVLPIEPAAVSAETAEQAKEEERDRKAAG